MRCSLPSYCRSLASSPDVQRKSWRSPSRWHHLPGNPGKLRRRLRAGFPSDWTVGDKTGTGLRNAVNDVAIVVPPGRAPILVTAYMSGGTAAMDASQAAHAKVASVVAREL